MKLSSGHQKLKKFDNCYEWDYFSALLQKKYWVLEVKSL
jgi:hypothetical protein